MSPPPPNRQSLATAEVEVVGNSQIPPPPSSSSSPSLPIFTALKMAFRRPAKNALPLYSPLGADGFDRSLPSPPGSADGFESDLEAPHSFINVPLKPAQRHANTTTTTSWLSQPSLSRFLADFTLGFADGLTVPFALTAGLSSLGQTETVIYAGLAEICAGSISMGIGGYLSAKGEAAAASPTKDEDEEESISGQPISEKGTQAVDRYLAPLDLPPELLNLVQQHVESRGDVSAAVARKLSSDHDDEEDEEEPLHPIMSGFSVAVGYLIGGSLPLFPYFLVGHVGDGLLWSFLVCIIALFIFGFTKDFVLHMHKQRQEEVWVKDKGLSKDGWNWRWRDVRRSSWEGTQMVLLGSMAALAAVLCVRLFEGMGHEQPAAV